MTRLFALAPASARPSLFGWSLDGSLAFFYFAYGSVILLALVLWWLLRSPWGRAFAALRDNPIRAESTGVNITAYTLLAFAIGAACAGIGGVYLSALVNFIEPGQFNLSVSLMMLLAVIVGGSGRFFGPVLGSVVVLLLPEWLRFLQDWYLAIFGFAVIVLKSRICAPVADRYTDTLPSSTPAEKPCSSRPATTSRGAAKPMAAYPGTQATESVPTDISASVSIRPARRPRRSM